jgi:phage tail protein X
VAGAEKRNQIFSRRSVAAIHDFSRGYPREINILADNALLLGYSRGTKKITPPMVKECYEDMQLNILPSKVSIQQTEKRRVEGTEPEDEHVQTKFESVKTPQSSRIWKWAAVLFFFLAFTVMGTSPIGKEILGRFNNLISSTYQASLAKIAEISPSEKNAEQRSLSNVKQADKLETQQTPSRNVVNHRIQKQAQMEETSADEIVERRTEAFDEREVAIREIEDNRKAETGNKAFAKPVATELSIQDKQEMPNKVVIVGRGDTLTGLTLRIYGKTSDDLIAMVKAANPGLRNINFIRSGQKIVFPQLPESAEDATFTVHIASYKLYEPALKAYRDLLENGFDVYILGKDDSQNGKIFRVTVGYFKTRKKAKDYADTIIKQGITTYAMPIEVTR